MARNQRVGLSGLIRRQNLLVIMAISLLTAVGCSNDSSDGQRSSDFTAMAGDAGSATGSGSDHAGPTALGDYSQYHDPGTGPFERGTPEHCKMDPAKFDDNAIAIYTRPMFESGNRLRSIRSIGVDRSTRLAVLSGHQRRTRCFNPDTQWITL